jgi:hypothetical protein
MWPFKFDTLDEIPGKLANSEMKQNIGKDVATLDKR